MTLRKLLRLFGIIVRNDNAETDSTRSKYVLIFRNNLTHCYAIIDIPDSYAINTTVLKKKELIIESHKLNDEFDEAKLQKRIKLLDHQLTSRLLRKKIKHH